MTPAMSTPGSRAMTIGLTVMLLSVSAGMHFDGFAFFLCFVGVLVGANLIAAGVRMAAGPAPNPIFLMVLGGARALAVFVRNNFATVWLVTTSCAITAVSGVEDPVLCFAMFVMLLLGLILINIGARGE